MKTRSSKLHYICIPLSQVRQPGKLARHEQEALANEKITSDLQYRIPVLGGSRTTKSPRGLQDISMDSKVQAQ
jgi:hypothetical protein